MNPITADRLELAGELEDLFDELELDGWSIYGTPPASIVVPAVVCTPSDPVGRYTHGSWSVPVSLWLYAEALNLEELEDAIAAILAADLSAPELRTAPSAQRYGGATYLGAVVVCPRVVALTNEPPAIPRK